MSHRGILYGYACRPGRRNATSDLLMIRRRRERVDRRAPRTDGAREEIKPGTREGMNLSRSMVTVRVSKSPRT